ncbi:MAG: alpha/beta hydrolase, partial [Alloalcanivorax venustensis]
MSEAAVAGAGHHIDTAGGYRVPVTWYAGAPDKPVMVLLPALGVAARFYDKLAATLTESGLNVAVMEQRGQGDSALRPGRRHNWGFAEVLDNDLPALLEWAETQRPGAP